jgi:hypothetical protein
MSKYNYSRGRRLNDMEYMDYLEDLEEDDPDYCDQLGCKKIARHQTANGNFCNNHYEQPPTPEES